MADPELVHPQPLAKRAAIYLGMASLFFATWLLLWFVPSIVVLTFAGVLFAIFLRGLSDPLARRTPLSEGWALLVTGLILLGITAGGVILLLNPISQQISDFASQLPNSLASLEQKLLQIPGARQVLGSQIKLNEVLGSGQWKSIISGARGVIFSTFGALGSLVFVLFVGIFVAAQPRIYTRNLIRLAPSERRENARGVLSELGEVLRWWMVGKVVAMTLVGVLTWAGLTLIGMKLALALAVIAGLFSFVPYLGPVLSAVPAVLLALSQSSQMVLYVAGVYTVVQFVESYLITPMVQRKAVNLAPAFLLSVQLLLGTMWGLVGLIFATPITATVVVLVNELYVKKQDSNARDRPRDRAKAA